MARATLLGKLGMAAAIAVLGVTSLAGAGSGSELDDESGAVARWRGTHFWSSDDGVVHAGQDVELWSVDVKALLPADTEQTPIYLRVLDDALYVGAAEHVLMLDPETGAVRRSWHSGHTSLMGVPEPKDPAPSPTKKNDGCDCSFALQEPPSGLAMLGLLVFALGSRRRAR